MSIWDLDIGWFALGTFVILSLIIIGMEWWCWRERKNMYIKRGGGK